MSYSDSDIIINNDEEKNTIFPAFAIVQYVQ